MKTESNALWYCMLLGRYGDKLNKVDKSCSLWWRDLNRSLGRYGDKLNKVDMKVWDSLTIILEEW
jgi:hypothetical protein